MSGSYQSIIIVNEPGIRLLETTRSHLDAWVAFGAYANLNNSNNDYQEVAVGITWMPNRQRDFKITLKVARVFFDNGTEDTNGVLQFEHYINW